MKKRFLHTTFGKMTFAFVIFGLIPLLVLGVFFVLNYHAITQNVVVSNYNEISSYFAKNVDGVIDSVDDAMKALYEYQNERGENLASVLKSDGSQSVKQFAVNKALYSVMEKSNYISGLRFVDQEGNLYSLYSRQDKVLSENAGGYTTMSVFFGGDLCRKIIQSAFEESRVCVDSPDMVFSVIRNYMDTTTIRTTTSRALGTLYADIDVNHLAKITNDMNLNGAECFVYNVLSGYYLYSNDSLAYTGKTDPLGSVKGNISGESGFFKKNDNWYFYHQIQDTTIYSVTRLSTKYVTGGYTETYLFMMMILAFSAAFLFILYMAFSIKMSEPTRKLYEAMEEAEKGNLNVEVDLHTGDEMQYVADGFNKMTKRLREYINQVYVAEICQKDAELNALKMQIQPHYLYNTLDVIRMTALDQNDEITADLLEGLAHQLRYVMGEHNDQVTLGEELDHIREYFKIMKIRYDNRINYGIDITDSDCELLIPKLILQPAIENAIRHGIREKQGSGWVSVHVERKGDILEIIVLDDGVGMSKEKVEQMMADLENTPVKHMARTGSVGIGLKNVYDRIKLNCGPQYGISIDSVEGMGTFITFRLPIIEKKEEAENV